MSSRLAFSLGIGFLVIAFAAPSVGQSGKGNKPAKTPAQPAEQSKGSGSGDGSDGSSSDISSASPSSISSADNDDHIPCELTEEQLLKLRPRPEQPTLNEDQAERLQRQVLQAVAKAQSNREFPRAKEFLNLLKQDQLSDLTLAEAQNRILQQLTSTTSSPDDSEVPPADKDLAVLRAKIHSLPSDVTARLDQQVLAKITGGGAVTIGQLRTLRSELNEYLLKEIPGFGSVEDVKTGIDILKRVADGISKADSSSSYFESMDTELYSQYRATQAQYRDWAAARNRPMKQCDAKTQKDCASQLYRDEAQALQDFLGASPAETVNSLAENSLIKNLNAEIFKATSSLEAVAYATHKAISAFARPDGVGCAMTILPWNSMRYTFGQKVADEYLGVQITVRNLNPEKEFLMHDAELAVDMDISGREPRHSRFFSGVDKQNVRAYMLAARDYDNRSLAVHILEGTATFLGSAAPIWGGAATDAASVFSGGFLPGVTHVWTDHHTEQLNQLNDVGFSASRNDRTFVPKSGSTQFVIFVPVQPLEEAWWTQGCVQAIPLGRIDKFVNDSEGGPLEVSSKSGLDVEALREICYTELSMGKVSRGFPKSSSAGAGNGAAETNAKVSLQTASPPAPSGIPYFNPMRVKYRRWTPTTHALLKEMAYAVVAGTHVTLSSETHPDISQIDCPHTSIGDLDFSAAKDGNLACNITGVNLDKADHLTLRSVTDTKTVDVPLTAANGGKTASVSMVVANLCPLKDSVYKVYTVSKEGIEDGGTQGVHLSLDPFLTGAPNPSSIPPDDSVDFTLAGCHLDNLAYIQLIDSTDKSKKLSNQTPSSSDAASASFELKGKDLFKNWKSKVDSGTSFKLSILLGSTSDPSNPKDSKQALTIQKAATATADNPQSK